jgi:peptidoglycan/LPS O-acetylase OafA/YrhL
MWLCSASCSYIAWTFVSRSFSRNDDDSDGDLYTQIASNVLERHVYSKDTDPPFKPTLVRLPGYPLFVAGIYALGHGDDETLRLAQGVLNTLTCVLIGLLACMWEPKQRHKRRAALAAFLLAAVCPFTAIYSAVLLTEAVTMFQSVALWWLRHSHSYTDRRR